MKVSIPGIGGLGECVVCGKSFAVEVITGGDCRFITVGGFDSELPVHERCITDIQTAMESKRWEDLPDGPLRQEFAKAASEI